MQWKNPFTQNIGERVYLSTSFEKVQGERIRTSSKREKNAKRENLELRRNQIRYGGAKLRCDDWFHRRHWLVKTIFITIIKSFQIQPFLFEHETPISTNQNQKHSKKSAPQKISQTRQSHRYDNNDNRIGKLHVIETGFVEFPSTFVMRNDHVRDPTTLFANGHRVAHVTGKWTLKSRNRIPDGLISLYDRFGCVSNPFCVRHDRKTRICVMASRQGCSLLVGWIVALWIF